MIEKNWSMSYEKTCKKMCTRNKGGNTDLPSTSLSSNLLVVILHSRGLNQKDHKLAFLFKLSPSTRSKNFPRF